MKSRRFVISVKGQKIFNEKFLNRILDDIIARTKIKRESIGRS